MPNRAGRRADAARHLRRAEFDADLARKSRVSGVDADDALRRARRENVAAVFNQHGGGMRQQVAPDGFGNRPGDRREWADANGAGGVGHLADDARRVFRRGDRNERSLKFGLRSQMRFDDVPIMARALRGQAGQINISHDLQVRLVDRHAIRRRLRLAASPFTVNRAAKSFRHRYIPLLGGARGG